MKCPECGTINSYDNNECVDCGFPFKKKIININKKSISMNILLILIIVSISIGFVFVVNSITELGKNSNSINDSNERNSKKTYSFNYEELVNNRNDANTVFSSSNDIGDDYIILGYKNNDYSCTKINWRDASDPGSCWKIKYTKDKENIKIKISNEIGTEIDCKESKENLVCYMDDGVTVRTEYAREK